MEQTGHDRPQPSRRAFLQRTGAWCAALFLANLASGPLPFFRRPAQAAEGAAASPSTIKAVLRRYFGDRKIAAKGVRLKVPIIAENGAVVPVKVVSDLPMQDDLYVKKIYIFVDHNTNPYIASAALSPANGRAALQLKIKMKQTSNVRAVAEMSDGSLYGDVQPVKVTIGGCGG